MDASLLALRRFLRSADEVRRQQGRALDRLGFGPQTSPSRTVKKWRAAHLLAYQSHGSQRPAMLIVPAPIKTAYIWDLAPGSSVVERCMAAGLQVYLIDWRRPQSGDEWMGLGEYADRVIGNCLNAIDAETGQPSVFVAGHSLGGTLAAIFSSLHPRRVRGLVDLEGPIEFGAGVFESVVARGPTATTVTDALGNVPGTFLNWASVYTDPVTFNTEPWFDWLESARSPAATRLHLQVRRWSLDESPMAGRLFEQVDHELYGENRFAERQLHVGKRLADPRAIDMPILAVVDPRSRIVPAPSVEAFRTRTRTHDIRFLHYAGDTGVVMQHVGVLVGSNAHAFLWPRILSWIKARAELPRA